MPRHTYTLTESEIATVRAAAAVLERLLTMQNHSADCQDCRFPAACAQFLRVLAEPMARRVQ